MLQQAIAAAKAGQKDEAREMFIQLLRADTANVQAWVWLSGLVAGDGAQIQCLERALHYNPDSTLLQESLAKARALQPHDLVRDAVAALDAGQQDRARELLLQALSEDETNIAAWHWLARVSESPDDQEVCYENILTLNPDNLEAREELEGIRRGQAVMEARRDYAPADEFYAQAGHPAAHIPTADEIAPTPVSVSATESGLNDELQCPYCAQPTLYDDRTCPHCHQMLWTRSAASGETGETRIGYWQLLVMEGLLFFAGWLLPLILLNYVAYQLDTNQIGWLLPIYLGLKQVSPEDAAIIFDLASPVLFWLSVIPSVLTLFIVVCMALRRASLFYVIAALNGLRAFVLLISLALVLLGQLGILSAPLVAGGRVIHPGLFSGVTFRYMRLFVVLGNGAGMVVSFVSFKLLMDMMDHFVAEERRMLLRLDRHLAPNAASYWLHGRVHAKEGRWAAAALHLRHSLVMEERFEASAQLAIAYAHLGYADKVAHTLADARRFSPDHPQLASLMTLLSNISASDSED